MGADPNLPGRVWENVKSLVSCVSSKNLAKGKTTNLQPGFLHQDVHSQAYAEEWGLETTMYPAVGPGQGIQAHPGDKCHHTALREGTETG